jgi:hypothetical protein
LPSETILDIVEGLWYGSGAIQGEWNTARCRVSTVRALAERDSRLILIGALGTALLAGAAVALPVLAASRAAPSASVARHLDRAVRTGSSRAFQQARQAALREHHRDLLGRHSPAVLQLVELVERTPSHCRPASGATPLVRAACHVRQGRYPAARQELASSPESAGSGAVLALLERLEERGRFLAAGRDPARSGMP